MKKIYNYKELDNMCVDDLYNIIKKEKIEFDYFDWLELRQLLIRIIEENQKEEDEKDD